MTSLPLLAQAGSSSSSEVVVFVVLAGIAIGSGIGMVAMRNIVHGALMLVINLLSLAGLYLLLQSTFLSIVQVIVYAGAIMVLFLFVIMLLGIDRDDLLVEVSPVSRVTGVLAGVGVVAMLTWGLLGPYTSAASVCDPDAAVVHTADTQTCAGMDALLDQTEQGSVEIVARDLFTRWTFPFEASALLLIVATLGAMLLGRRHDTDPDDDPAWVPSMRLPDAADGADPATGSDDADDVDEAVTTSTRSNPTPRHPPMPRGNAAGPRRCRTCRRWRRTRRPCRCQAGAGATVAEPGDDPSHERDA